MCWPPAFWLPLGLQKVSQDVNKEPLRLPAAKPPLQGFLSSLLGSEQGFGMGFYLLGPWVKRDLSPKVVPSTNLYPPPHAKAMHRDAPVGFLKKESLSAQKNLGDQPPACRAPARAIVVV